MLTTILALLLAADTTPPAVADAQQDVATAAHLRAICWTPAECRVADELATAAEVEHAAAVALHSVPVPQIPDPFQPSAAEPFEAEYSNPFEEDDQVPEALEAQAAFELAELQNQLDALVR